jgi:tetratricopeptide (TPR) repeat protein
VNTVGREGNAACLLERDSLPEERDRNPGRDLPGPLKSEKLTARPFIGGNAAVMSRNERRRLGTTAKPSAAERIATAPTPAAALRLARLQREMMALAQAGQPRRALAACRELLALQPFRPDLLSFAGTLAFQLGDFGDAAALYRQALAVKPDAAELHYNLANALSESGRLAEAAAAHQQAITLRPDFAAAHHNLANALRALGRPEEAIESYRLELACRSTAAGERDLGIALHDLGRLDEAIAAYRRCLALPGHRVDVLSNLANALMEEGDARGALEVCDRYLAIEPANIEAQALKALALHEVGQDDEARVLLDFDRFVRIIDFAAPPPGYPSLAAFNAALVDHIEAHPTLRVPRKDDPKYHHDALEITGELFAEPRGPMAAFETLMRDAVLDYIETIPRRPAHPFIEQLPQKWVFGCWATRLAGQGNLDPHIHFTGYIGGVYYPLLPDVVAAPDEGGAGWFELLRPPERFRCAAAPWVRRIQPREGRLLIFPGYFFHNTIPFTSTQRRISIAFDVMRRD